MATFREIAAQSVNRMFSWSYLFVTTAVSHFGFRLSFTFYSKLTKTFTQYQVMLHRYYNSSNPNSKPLAISIGCTDRLLSDLVGKPQDTGIACKPLQYLSMALSLTDGISEGLLTRPW